MARLKRFGIALGIIVFFFTLLYVFRFDVLRAFGNYLIEEDHLEQCPVLFVLSGGPWDRGNEAARLFKKGYADRIVCTGKNLPHNFKALGMDYPESEITRLNLIRNNNIADSSVKLIKKGRSTFEESNIILDYCQDNNIDKCIIVSSKFHTRRIDQVFEEKFANSGIDYILRGAPSTNYEEQRWWANEYGLIALNNEYIKIFYYWWKY